MSGALLFFFLAEPWPLWKCFHVLCLRQAESGEGKHSLLQTTCNRFLLKPNKSTLCFRSCDTFFVLCVIPNISYVSIHPLFPSSSSSPIATLTRTVRMHVRTFPFPVRKITWTGEAVRQRSALGQENRKESSRVSYMQGAQSRGWVGGRKGRSHNPQQNSTLGRK